MPSASAAAAEIQACANAMPFVGANESLGHGDGIIVKLPAQLLDRLM